MVKRAKTHTRRVNPVARGLHLPLTPSRVVKPKKGQGRKGRRTDAGAGTK
jgi:hypothetical protein